MRMRRWWWWPLSVVFKEAVAGIYVDIWPTGHFCSCRLEQESVVYESTWLTFVKCLADAPRCDPGTIDVQASVDYVADDVMVAGQKVVVQNVAAWPSYIDVAAVAVHRGDVCTGLTTRTDNVTAHWNFDYILTTLDQDLAFFSWQGNPVPNFAGDILNLYLYGCRPMPQVFLRFTTKPDGPAMPPTPSGAHRARVTPTLLLLSIIASLL